MTVFEKNSGADGYKRNEGNGNEEAGKKKEEDQSDYNLVFFWGLCPL